MIMSDHNLKELYWLPVPSHITFNVTLLVLVRPNQCPAYISEVATSVSCGPSQRRLHSSGTDYIVRRTRTKFGKIAFSVDRPSGTLSERVISATWKHCLSVISRQYFNIYFNTLRFITFLLTV